MGESVIAQPVQRADGRDEWETPPAVYNAICDHWSVYPNYDVAASQSNSKCPRYFGLEPWTTNAFDLDWVGTATSQNKEPTFWMNPPYSEPLMTKFIEKAIFESYQGATVLFLLPAWVDRPFYHDFIKHFEHTFWPGRIKHIPPAGIKPSSPRYGSIHGVIRNGKS